MVQGELLPRNKRFRELRTGVGVSHSVEGVKMSEARPEQVLLYATVSPNRTSTE